MRALLALSRLRVSLASALSALIGYMFHASAIAMPDVLPLFFGVFLLAAAASALNQIQERGLDSMMERTSGRPLVRGTVSLKGAWTLVFLSGAGGMSLLYMNSPLAALLGIVAVVLYNLVYTPLKPHSRHCLFVGALAGAMPPVMGWAYGGGQLSDPFVPVMFGFFYIWQIPHSLFIHMRYREQYRAAGLPVLSDRLTQRQLRSISISWILSCLCAGLIMASQTPGADKAGVLVLCVLLVAGSFVGTARRVSSGPAL